MTRILAIDDNYDNLITLGAIIKESFPDLDFDTALSGKKGIELAISSNPDVILLDIVMPDMDGFEVCRRLKQDEQLCDIPVVFLTALKENKENRIKALEVGGEAFLYKPIDETELVAQIRAMVKIKEFANQKRNENERLSRLVAERTQDLEKSQTENLKLLNKLKAENEKYKKTENELKESEERYRLLHESAGVGIGYYTPDGTVISYNKIAALNMNGKPEDFVGKSIYSLFPKDDADFYMDRIKKALNSEISQQYEDRVELPKEVKWFQSVFTRILHSTNQVAGVQIISTDITEQKRTEEALKESEAKFRDLFTQMNEGFALHQIIYDANHIAFDYKILDINPAFEKQVGISIEKAKGVLATELYDVSPAPFLDIYAQVAETGEHQYFQTYFPPLDRHFQISVFSPIPGYFATVFTDITERVKGDEALSNMNDLISKFILHSPIYTFIKEVTPNESTVLKASENFIDMIGIAGSQMVGKNMHELFPPEFADQMTADDWEVASNDHLIHLDEELNGRYYITIKYPIKQENKTLLAGYTIDITERKKAEKALLEREQRYRLIFDNSHDALLLTNSHGAIQSANPAASKMFGRSQEEICMLGRSGIIDISDPRLTDALEERARTGKFSGELTGLRKDGTKFPVEISTTIFPDSDGNLRTSMIIRDISERKRTEKLLIESEANARAIMEATEDVLILMNKEGIIIDCNEVHAQRLSTTRKELLGKNVFDRLPTDVAETRRKHIHEAISSGKPVYGEDCRGGLYNEFSIYPIFVQNKITDRVAIFARDITARKQDEEALKENEARLQELNATKDKFFSIISHDLKNPFNSILGLSNLLVEQIGEKDFEGIEEYARIIQKASTQAYNLLVNLLDWSRSQTGRMEFSPEYVEMVSLIHEVIELFVEQANQKSITIFEKLPRNMLIYADKAMISAVLRNLISNAIKFTHPNGQINISAQSNKDGWIFAVQDNGVGMKNKNIEKLFRIAENQTTLGTKNEKGTGLGLILCKEFINKHGGKIWVESEVEKGSKFYFSIPKH